MYELLLARVELEIKYAIEPETVIPLLAELYEDLEGRKPRKRMNLLNWFFENYVYDGKGGWDPKPRRYH